MEPNFQDFLGWALEKDVLNVIKDEILYFSGKVYKYNSFSIKQERNLVLTDKCLYNFHNKKVKRTVLLISFSIVFQTTGFPSNTINVLNFTIQMKHRIFLMISYMILMFLVQLNLEYFRI